MAMPEPFDPTKWLTTKEAAELTGYTVRYLRQLANEGKIRAVKRGGLFWIDKGSLAAYTDQMKQLGPSKHDPWRTGARHRHDEAD